MSSFLRRGVVSQLRRQAREPRAALQLQPNEVGIFRQIHKVAIPSVPCRHFAELTWGVKVVRLRRLRVDDLIVPDENECRISETEELVVNFVVLNKLSRPERPKN